MALGIETLLQSTVDQADYVGQLRKLGERREPTVFGMRTQLPSQGRADMPVAATERMSVIVKTYAEGGENALHAHPHEDHVFVVLQGRIRFYGEDGELARLGRHQGILLPCGAYYRFEVEPDEAVVMLRVGCATDPAADQWDRVNSKNAKAEGWGVENKTKPLVLTGQIFE